MKKYEKMKDALTNRIIDEQEKHLDNLKNVRKFVYQGIINEDITLDDVFYYVADLITKIEEGE